VSGSALSRSRILLVNGFVTFVHENLRADADGRPRARCISAATEIESRVISVESLERRHLCSRGSVVADKAMEAAQGPR